MTKKKLLSQADRLLIKAGFDPKTMLPLGKKSQSVRLTYNAMGNGMR